MVNAQTWAPIGSGMLGGLGVACVTVYNGELVAGGNFTSAGFTPVSRIAKWNGTSWSGLGSGVSGEQNFVQAMEVFNGNLWVGGNFLTAGGQTSNYVSRWNGTTWLALPTFPSAGVYDFQVYGGELVVCGNFEFIGGITYNYIAKWGGSSWSPLGGGMNQAGVYALTVYNGELIAGGNFTSAGGVPASNIARWNGSSWRALGQGVSGGTLNILALGVYNGELYAGGDFTTAGGAGASRVARWNGSTWLPLSGGVNGTALVFYVLNNELVVGGMFSTANGMGVNYLARWNGSGWFPLASGGMNFWVRALGTYNSNFIAGGSFTSAGGTTALFIARTDQPLPVNLSGFGSSVVRNNVILEWTTDGELNNKGFDIERKTINGSWFKTGNVVGNGTTEEPKSYKFTDRRLQKGVYNYRLKQIDYNGNYEYFELSNDVNIVSPGGFFVSQNYPNPSNPKSRIDYELPENSRITIKIYDFSGREILTLIDKVQEAGYYTAEFDGTSFASGIYFYKLLVNNNMIDTRKMVLLK
jgi:Secretion system C-terminal sorting domain